MQLRLIGYWRSDREPDLPDPTRLIALDWDPAERDRVADYYAYGTVCRAYMGRSACRICGTQNGSAEFTDGEYIWPEGLSHYIRDHGVRPPADVVRWAIDRTNALDRISVDRDWWVTATASN